MWPALTPVKICCGNPFEKIFEYGVLNALIFNFARWFLQLLRVLQISLIFPTCSRLVRFGKNKKERLPLLKELNVSGIYSEHYSEHLSTVQSFSLFYLICQEFWLAYCACLEDNCVQTQVIAVVVVANFVVVELCLMKRNTFFSSSVKLNHEIWTTCSFNLNLVTLNN